MVIRQTKGTFEPEYNEKFYSILERSAKFIRTNPLTFEAKWKNNISLKLPSSLNLK